MKTIKLTIFAAAMLVAALAQGQATVGFTNTVNAVVPDANPTGLTVSQSLSAVPGDNHQRYGYVGHHRWFQWRFVCLPGGSEREHLHFVEPCRRDGGWR